MRRILILLLSFGFQTSWAQQPSQVGKSQTGTPTPAAAPTATLPQPIPPVAPRAAPTPVPAAAPTSATPAQVPATAPAQPGAVAPRPGTTATATPGAPAAAVPANPAQPVVPPTAAAPSAAAPSAANPASDPKKWLKLDSRKGLDETNRACFVEIQRYCKTQQDDVVALRKCLYPHLPQMAGLCKRHVTEYSQVYLKRLKEQVDLACSNDIKLYCANIKFGENKLGPCLKGNPKVSPKCKSELQRLGV